MLYFLIAGIAFLGSLPMGLVNISVLHTAGTLGRRSARMMSRGAVAGELIPAIIALLLGDLVNPLFQASMVDDWLLIFVLSGAGIFFIMRRGYRPVRKNMSGAGNILSGFTLSLLNPQSVPFWVFVLVSLDKTGYILHSGYSIFLFLAGVASGKYLALWLYSWSGRKISKLISVKTASVNFASGSVMILVALIHFVRIEWFM